MSKISQNTWFWILVFIGYCISVGLRYDYVALFSAQEQYLWNGTLMINSNDGYMFARWARNVIDGEIGFFEIPPSSYMSYILIFFYYLTPFSLEQLMLYLPGFIGSLVVIPVMILARGFGNLPALLGGVVSGICVSYYNRTMFGYFDTDMLIAPLFMGFAALLITLASKIATYYQKSLSLFDLWRDFNYLPSKYKTQSPPPTTTQEKTLDILYPSVLKASFHSQEFLGYKVNVWYFLAIPVFVINGILLYQSSQYIYVGFLLILFSYLVLFDRKNCYLQIACIILTLSLLITTLLSFQHMGYFYIFNKAYTLFHFFTYVFYYSPLWDFIFKENVFIILIFELLLMLGIVYFYKTSPSTQKLYKSVYWIMIISIVVYLLYSFGGFLDGIFTSKYIDTGDTKVLNFTYPNVINTVAETSGIDFSVFSARIAGNEWLFILSFIGVLIAFCRNRFFLLLLVPLAIGYLAYFKGLRFTIYAVSVHAIGFSAILWAFLLLWKKVVTNYLPHLSNLLKKGVSYLIIVAFSILTLFPMVVHIYTYLFPPVFVKEEVVALEQLHKISKPQDLAIAWWDYGFPIQYYGGMQTYIDGAKQDGRFNYPVSLVLTSPSLQVAYNTALIISISNDALDTFAYKQQIENTQQLIAFLLQNLDFSKKPDIFSYDKTNNTKQLVGSFLQNDKFLNTPTTRDIYIVLPTRMTDIFLTVASFSSILVENGERLPLGVFAKSDPVIREDANYIYFSSKVRINRARGEIEALDNNQAIRMYQFITVSRNKDGKNEVSRVSVDNNSPLAVVFVREWGQMFIMDRTYLDSLYIRGAMLEDLNPNYFQLVVGNPSMKIYKVLQH